MRTILIIGIGAGNPDHVTMQAVDALNRAHAVFIPDKGAEKHDLRRLRLEICRRFISHPRTRYVEFEALRREAGEGGYRRDVEAWHERCAAQYADLLRRELGEGEVGAFLVWGDPSLYDSTIRIVEAAGAHGGLALELEVIPGITSVQALTARHRIPLNRIGRPVHLTTGRRLAEDGPDDNDSIVVMLDGEQAFNSLDGEAFDIYWGAYLGTADEILVSGRLSEVAGEIERRRAEARRRKGWVMDTYLLRRRGS